MKIAQVNVYFYPSMIGGVEWYIFNISQELIKRGHEVHVFTTLQKGLEPEEVVRGIQVHRFPLRLSLSYRIKIWHGLTTALMKQDFDVIHAYDYAQFHDFVAIRAGKLRKIPVVITVFDVHSLVPRPLYKRIPMIVYDRAFSRWIFKNVDKVLIRTQTLASYFTQLGVPREKIAITPSGIKSEALHPVNGKQFREKHSIDGPLVLYIGRLHPSKGLQFLIRATPIILEEFPNAKIVIVGPDQVGFGKVLHKLSNELNVSRSILFLEPIYSLREKMQVYAACNVFVLPSGYEGFGQVLIEAMTQGKPIIATRVGGIPNVIKDGQEGFLIDYGNLRTLADAILKLLNDRDTALSMGESGRKKAMQFTYDVLASDLEKIYRRLVKET